MKVGGIVAVAVCVISVIVTVLAYRLSRRAVRNWNVLVQRYPVTVRPTFEPLVRRSHVHCVFPDQSEYSGPIHVGVAHAGLFLSHTWEHWPDYRPVLIPWPNIKAVTMRREFKEDSFQPRERTHYVIASGEAEVRMQFGDQVRKCIGPYVQNTTIDER